MVTKKFSRSDGPFVKNLDKLLSSFHVERQAYYGGIFVGESRPQLLEGTHNGIDKVTINTEYVLQTNHMTMLCDSVPAIAHQHCPYLATQAQQIADKALLLFSVSHNSYVQNYVNTSELDQLGKYRNIYHCFITYLLQPTTSYLS